MSPTAPRQASLTRFLTRAEGTSRRWAQLVAVNQELTRSREALMKAHRAKSAFLAGLSHQLRTPLNTILLCSELLADDLAEQGLRHLTGDLDRIQGAGKLLLSLLDDVLDLTRLEAGRMVFQQEPTDLDALLHRLREAFRTLAQKQGNTLELSRDSALPALQTDPGKLEQILFHLVENALRCTRDGLVTLEVKPLEDGPGVRFTVRDTGRGMSAEQVERLRLDFTQTQDSHAQTFGNAGLGLTLCRRLAEGLGGRLQVESVLAVGSTFTLRLP